MFLKLLSKKNRKLAETSNSGRTGILRHFFGRSNYMKQFTISHELCDLFHISKEISTCTTVSTRVTTSQHTNDFKMAAPAWGLSLV
jgi:hypothetical protein